MKNSIVFGCALLLFVGKINAQAVGIGTATPNSSALLDVSSAGKGVLVPRVSLTALNDAATIVTPATSLLVYNTNAALAGGTGYFYNNGTPAAPAWVKLLTSTSAGWSLGGNAGTDAATNFVGTTDFRRLHFRVNNWPSGWIDYLGSGTTFFGFGAGKAYTFGSGSQSTGFGYNVMTTGIGARNVAMGASAMASNGTFGYYNVAVGFEALHDNNDGQANVAVGNTSLHSNIDGDRNVAVGDSAMFSSTAGGTNVAIGNNALKNASGGTDNVAVGSYALENSSATNNTAIGRSSMRNNAGSNNTAVGYFSLRSNTSGSRNAVLGASALDVNTTGERNVAMGYATLGANTVGSYNTALGYIALNSNVSGDSNVAVGANALASSSGDANTAVGYNALGRVNTASNNIAVGKSALHAMMFTNGGSLWAGDNVAVGVEALYSTNPNAASALIPTNGVRNVALGNYALHDNTTGQGNIAVGHESLLNNTTGAYNIAIGRGAMQLNTTGAGNTALGLSAGSFNNANDYCTFIGYDADQSSGSNYTGSVALGYNSRITASDQVRIGNSSTSSIGGYAPWSNLSDGRFKKNISEQVKGLDFIMALRPVTYNIDVNQLATYLKEDMYKDKTGNILAKPVNERVKQERNEESLVLHTGFVAQEVEAAAKKLNYDFSGVDKPKNATDLYALRYSEFVVPLVKGMQEQQQEIIALKERIAQLEALIKSALPKIESSAVKN
jgi:hypothetical protein